MRDTHGRGKPGDADTIISDPESRRSTGHFTLQVSVVTPEIRSMRYRMHLVSYDVGWRAGATWTNPVAGCARSPLVLAQINAARDGRAQTNDRRCSGAWPTRELADRGDHHDGDRYDEITSARSRCGGRGAAPGARRRPHRRCATSGRARGTPTRPAPAAIIRGGLTPPWSTAAAGPRCRARSSPDPPAKPAAHPGTAGRPRSPRTDNRPRTGSGPLRTSATHSGTAAP